MHSYGMWGCGPRFMGRHGGRGFGGFGGPFGGGPGFGGGHLRMGRMLAAGDLQLIVLALLAEKPRHGYEVIKALEERSRGFYVPSPGMVYPALTYLEEIGHATVEAEGAKKLYSITPAGRAYLDANREAVEGMLHQLARMGRKMERVRQFFWGDEEEPAERGRYRRPDDEAGEREPPGVTAAKRALGDAIADRVAEGGPEEEARIAAILYRAATAIRSGES